MFLDVPMQPILVVDSAQAATDLLEKRSHLYSDRLQLLMPKLMSWDFSMALMPYGADWRAHRKAFHRYFEPNALPAYDDIIRHEISACISRLLDSPENITIHVRQMFASMILQIVYGMKIHSLDDEFIRVVEEALDGANRAGAIGENWVEFLPFLQYIPSWLPGGRTSRLAERYKPFVENMIKGPLQKVRSALNEGVAIPCIANSMLMELQDKVGSSELPLDQERLLRNVTGVAYIGASDTTVSAVTSFLLAMALYPNVQKKAQEELDRVVGTGRLPEPSDWDSLVYIQAVTLETMRWIPAGPLAVPHRLTEDDEYNGYFIPAGTIVIPNAWAMLHDPSDYPEPGTFKPERFIKDGRIDPNVRNPRAFAFGFGRRVCPGEDLGFNAVGLFIATALQVFNISAGVDADSKPQKLSTEVRDGFIIHPITVPTGISPRSDAAERLIREQPASV
ncbi:cytochrome P450 [Cristinia sonorae]|uniref:Cytochrome P450 n=1 Tax=Cristinia sonorae TaxID=1940300 RepID=A0A8K0UM20_9AGAR|nr:cytochrome P450 [Cristinia sonorae]